MLTLLQNLMKSAERAVLPGGPLDDGDWALLTDVDWNDQDGADWDAWENTSDGS